MVLAIILEDVSGAYGKSGPDTEMEKKSIKNGFTFQVTS